MGKCLRTGSGLFVLVVWAGSARSTKGDGYAQARTLSATQAGTLGRASGRVVESGWAQRLRGRLLGRGCAPVACCPRALGSARPQAGSARFSTVKLQQPFTTLEAAAQDLSLASCPSPDKAKLLGSCVTG
jgi:hypothetical protein